MCLVSVCHVEAQSENVDAIDSQEMNMDSMNHETIQNILTLLKSLSLQKIDQSNNNVVAILNPFITTPSNKCNECQICHA